MVDEIKKEELVKQSNKALIWTGVVIAFLVVALVTNGFGLFNPTTGNVISGEDFVALSVDGSPVLGDSNAPVTIYEFSDFSCPYCAAVEGKNQAVIDSLKARNPSWQPAVPNIIKDYVETGKVKIIFKYFPGHGSGNAAHLVGWALNEQGLFWEFRELAFADQEKTGDIVAMKEIAKQLGADMEKLEADINSGKYDFHFTRDFAMGQSNGVSGTPSFLINGNLVSGAVSYSEFKKVIDKELF